MTDPLTTTLSPYSDLGDGSSKFFRNIFNTVQNHTMQNPPKQADTFSYPEPDQTSPRPPNQFIEVPF